MVGVRDEEKGTEYLDAIPTPTRFLLSFTILWLSHSKGIRMQATVTLGVSIIVEAKKSPTGKRHYALYKQGMGSGNYACDLIAVAHDEADLAREFKKLVKDMLKDEDV